MGDELGWNHPLILIIDPNFQRDIQVWNMLHLAILRVCDLFGMVSSRDPWPFQSKVVNRDDTNEGIKKRSRRLDHLVQFLFFAGFVSGGFFSF